MVIGQLGKAGVHVLVPVVTALTQGQGHVLIQHLIMAGITVQEHSKRLGSVILRYIVQVRYAWHFDQLIYYIFLCVSILKNQELLVNFKNLEKNATFLKLRKKSTISKLSIVWCFQVGQTSL